ncbi:MAG TPA: cell division protein ZapA [Bryobacteraceae bacterium]|nr:cell division protein ZapA [Bryobacteraceae bacterium]
MDTADANKQTVRVSIFNQTYTVSTAGDARDTEVLAQQVDELMSSIARRAGNLDTTRTAVLACLHLADRLRTVESQLEALRLGISHKTRDFAILLDQVVGDSEIESG